MCSSLSEEERTRFRKLKKNGQIAATSGLVGMKEYLKTYNNAVKYFLPYLSSF